jgi:threonylcarbamoyladenosine tRNA methylthiotransferase MtaB
MTNQQIVTFGCRLNIFESEIIRNAINGADENIIVFNTCAVTSEAERQARQAIRKAYKKNPDAKIIVTGCAAQINPEKYAAMPEVSKIIGNIEKLDPASYSITERVQVNDIMSVTETAAHLVSNFEGKARAFMQVQNGCNHRCTFCIIPYGRGNSRSVPLGDIVTQAATLVESGYNEIVLTGVDITDYGKDLPGQPSFGSMIKRLLNLVPQLQKLRISSIDVAEIDADLMQLIKYEPRIMPHIHISLQSGDNLILKRMKRRHVREDVINFVKQVRVARPEIAFGADIIAGFPTENDAMFTNSLNLVHEAGLQFLHIFPYSPREGTPAAKMPQVDGNIIKQRAAKLRLAGEEQLIKFLRNKINTTEQVIIEQKNSARCADFTNVTLNNDYAPGSIINVKFTGVLGTQLLGSEI